MRMGIVFCVSIVRMNVCGVISFLFGVFHGQYIPLWDVQWRGVAIRIGGVFKQHRVVRINLEGGREREEGGRGRRREGGSF